LRDVVDVLEVVGEVEVVEEIDFEEAFEKKVIRVAHLGPETQDSEIHPDSPSRLRIVEYIAG
jgi:hypothetical protein